MTREKCEKKAPRGVGFGPRRAAFSFLWIAIALGGCRASCTEETGAEPVVVVEAGTPLGAPKHVATTMPRIRPVVPLHAGSATPADSAENE